MSSPDFTKFSKPVHDRFVEMSKNELYVVDIEGEEMWAAYLQAFPAGTNLIHKTRTEYDCSCCKQVVKNIGNVVMIEADGKLRSVWGMPDAYPFPFDYVSTILNDLVTSAKIVGVFRSSERKYGTQETKQLVDLADGSKFVKSWNHFYVDVAARHYTTEVATVRGEKNTTAQVYERGLRELSISAVDQVLELIDTKALYRGEEHLAAVKDFAQAKRKYDALVSEEQKNVFVWQNFQSPSARFRNTVIGTLVTDISGGLDLETAVRGFESKVAPVNYKRPTALITPRMIEQAMKTIKDEGLDTALERRFAKISDVSVNNVLWVNNETKGLMKVDSLQDALLSTVKKEVKLTDVENVSINDFMVDVLPHALNVEALVKNVHLSNFVSLTAPVYADAEPLFKWNNAFGWSYDGNITDSIKERVKAAGGNVTNAKLRISLSWSNYDDLDLHVVEPSKYEICFYQKKSPSGGYLDVDMNAGSGTTRSPVENVSYARGVADGKYGIYVNNYSQRETSDVGCVIEIEVDGLITQLSHPSAIKPTNITRSTGVLIATLHMRNGKVEKLEPAKGVIGGGVSQDKWGVKTEDFVKVDTVMFSPNYWDDNAVGNKHWFFMLNGCKNDLPVRGIYNEFLDSRFEKHRKVFEVLGEKTKAQPTSEQLSGLGFSSTRDAVLTVRVKSAKLQKVYNIHF